MISISYLFESIKSVKYDEYDISFKDCAYGDLYYPIEIELKNDQGSEFKMIPSVYVNDLLSNVLDIDTNEDVFSFNIEELDQVGNIVSNLIKICQDLLKDKEWQMCFNGDLISFLNDAISWLKNSKVVNIEIESEN